MMEEERLKKLRAGQEMVSVLATSVDRNVIKLRVKFFSRTAIVSNVSTYERFL